MTLLLVIRTSWMGEKNGLIQGYVMLIQILCLKSPNIMMQLALVPTFIIYTFDLHIAKKYKYIINFFVFTHLQWQRMYCNI
jgi:hypothetical protein